MKLRFLGTGTSNGVPVLGCDCEVCRSNDPRDKRFRTSALLETESTRLLIDCGPDARLQLMPVPFRRIDGVLITHIHYDHVAGIDDLRPYCTFGDIDIYADEATAAGLKRTMPYCFTDTLYPGVPRLNLHSIAPRVPFRIGDIEVLPLQVWHGKLPILAYRFGSFAYITDMKRIDAQDEACLAGVRTLVINGLRWEREHHSHILIADAIDFARRIGADKTYITHLTHNIGCHEEASKRLPENVFFAYDGLELEV